MTAGADDGILSERDSSKNPALLNREIKLGINPSASDLPFFTACKVKTLPADLSIEYFRACETVAVVTIGALSEDRFLLSAIWRYR
jgi:hypothetical protein